MASDDVGTVRLSRPVMPLDVYRGRKTTTTQQQLCGYQ